MTPSPASPDGARASLRAGSWVSGGPRAEWTLVYHRPMAAGRLRSHGIREQRVSHTRPRFERSSRLDRVPRRTLGSTRAGDHRRLGRTLWDELTARYCRGVQGVRGRQDKWQRPHGKTAFEETRAFLAIQEEEARWWRDAACSTSTFRSGLPDDVARRCRARDTCYVNHLRTPVTSPRTLHPRPQTSHIRPWTVGNRGASRSATCRPSPTRACVRVWPSSALGVHFTKRSRAIDATRAARSHRRRLPRTLSHRPPRTGPRRTCFRSAFRTALQSQTLRSRVRAP